ncbi:MAG: hypothetical protein GY849_13130 [Deltaproteobacteria bacterium]|nr:hypothetical protein [Deltaproteobacteria bacterium]
MKRQTLFGRKAFWAGLLMMVLCGALVGGCYVKLVATYDPEVEEAIVELGIKVDALYGRILETPEDKRGYDQFADQYVAVDADLRSLLMRNELREKNQESTDIVKTTQDLFQKYREKHKQSAKYKTVLATKHRERFMKLFTAMFKAERAKKME